MKVFLLNLIAAVLLVSLAGCAGWHSGLQELPGKRYGALDRRWLKQELYAQYAEWRAVPHRSGGLSKSGIDCSGFVYVTYLTKLGIKLPRNSEAQMRIGRAVETGELSTGDLVFFITGDTDRHVGIYLDARQFVHVSLSKGVTISSLDERYWAQRYWKATRVLG